MAIEDRGNILPSRTRCDFLLVRFHAAPGGYDDVGVATDHVGRFYDALLRSTPIPQLRKYRLTPCYFDQFLHPPNTANKRIFPFLKEHAGTMRKRFCCFCDLL